MSIPKIIHYCWFGNKPLNQEILKYIETWKKKLPDYQIIEWNESNFDVQCNQYVKDAYQLKKYAFVSDYARLYALYEHGGIYLDTDIEVLKNLDSLLDNHAVLGFESDIKVMTAFIATEKKHPIIKEMLDLYKNLTFDCNNMIPNTDLLTNILSQYDLKLNGQNQKLKNDLGIVYSFEYFSGYDFSDATLCVNNNSFTVHHCMGSWCSKKDKILFKLKELSRKILGKGIYHFIKGIKKKIVK